MDDPNVKEIYMVFGVIDNRTVVSNILETKLKAEEWIKNHHIYNYGIPMYIMKATKWQKPKTDEKQA